MSQSPQPYVDPAATPVGHSGTRVQINERQAWSISGWFGVLIIAVCIAGTVLLFQHKDGAIASAPITVAVLIAGSLIIVQPGQTKVVRFFGSYVGTVRKTGLTWILPLSDRKEVRLESGTSRRIT